VRGDRECVAVRLAVTVTVEQQFRKGALPAGHRMQAGADTLPHPIAFPERLAVAAPVNPPEHIGEPKPQSDPCADPNTRTRCDAHPVALRDSPPPLAGEGKVGA
jgi:hypothetical protein